MTKNNFHINPEDPLEFFSKASISWDKSREDAWDDLSQKLESEQPARQGRIFPHWTQLLTAAIVLFLVGIPSVMRFYTVKVESLPGKHLAITLPDGSSVVMNAATNISYHPYWWRFSRQVRLDGEAFFSVQKGTKFEVISTLGETSVLGTTFDIYARNRDYHVACFTGKVRVVPVATGKSPIHEQAVVLNPNDQVSLTHGGSFVIERNGVIQHVSAWMKNEFVFTATPISRVIEEIGLQYGKSIKLMGSPNYFYTGNFAKDSSIEKVLNLVCRPFELKYVIGTRGEYQIIQNQ